MTLKYLKNQVESVLESNDQTRNSDITLTIEIWKAYYPHKVADGTVALNDLYDLPREDNVKRIRAKIQNEEGRFLPTNEDIRKKRGISEEKWRKWLGYAPRHEVAV